MDKKDTVVVGLVVLLVLVVAFSSNLQTTGKATSLKCSDTDGGDSRFVKGTISGIDSTGVPYSQTDYCTGDGRIKEYKCNIGQGNPGWTNIFYSCEKGCVDGACIS